MKAERIRSKANKTRRTTDSLEEETRAMEERLALVKARNSAKTTEWNNASKQKCGSTWRAARKNAPISTYHKTALKKKRPKRNTTHQLSEAGNLIMNDS